MGVGLVATVVAFGLLAGCASASDGDDIEALIDERIEAVLAKQAATTTTEVATDIEALIDERVRRQAARISRVHEHLLQYVDCDRALDDFALNIKHLLILDELLTSTPFLRHNGSDDSPFGDIASSMGDLFTGDGKMLGETKAERLCFDDGYGLPLSILGYDRLVVRLDDFLQMGRPLYVSTPWRDSCEHGWSLEGNVASIEMDKWCEKVLTRYRD